MKRLKKTLPFILFIAGAAIVIYFNWQLLIGFLLMVAGGYVWQQKKEKSQ